VNRIEERRADPAQRAPDADDTRPDLANAEPTAAFARLFDTHARALHGYLAGRVGVDVADDLVAETFLVALRRRAGYDPTQAPIRGWLYGIVDPANGDFIGERTVAGAKPHDSWITPGTVTGFKSVTTKVADAIGVVPAS
jgi:hypothetical protein